MRLIKSLKTRNNYFNMARELKENANINWEMLYYNMLKLKFWHKSIMRPKYDSYTKAGYIEIPQELRQYSNNKQWLLCYEIHW